MHVYLATDGSPHAEAAEAFLAEFPFAERPKLTVATVCPAADLRSMNADVTGPVAAMLDQCREQAANLLQTTVSRCQAWAGDVHRLLLDGHPADELLRSIDREQPDLVAVGSRGLGAVRRLLLGSVSERLVKHVRCSVLVAHPRTEGLGLRSILMAEDGSTESAAAVDRFAALPLPKGCTVHLLSIVETVHIYGTEMLLEGSGNLDAERRRVDVRQKQMAEKLRRHGAQVKTTVLTSSDVAAEILQFAEQQRSDLVVVGSRGKSAWERFLLGSVTLRVLHQAPCSVWIERVKGPGGT